MEASLKVKSKRVSDGKGGYTIQREVISSVPPKPNCYVVAGSIRGGTTLTAGILHHLGVWMGPAESFHVEKDGTVGGFFKHMGFQHLWQDMAVKHWKVDVKDHWWDIVKVRQDIPPLEGKHLQWFSNLIWKAEQYPVWGLKTFPLLLYWDDFTRICHSNIHIIRINRDLGSVAVSVDRFNYHPRENDSLYIASGWYALRDWALRQFTGPDIKLNYEDIITDPVWGVETLARFCKRSPNQTAIDFINPEYKHF